MSAQKFIAMFLVSKGRDPARAGSGQGSGEACEPEALFDSGATNKVMEESGIKAIPGADRVHRLHQKRGGMELLLPAARKRTGLTALHDQQRNLPGQNLHGLFDVVRMCDLRCLSLIREQDVHETQHSLEIVGPNVVRVIVGVERSRQSGLFRRTKQLRDLWTQSTVQVVRREVQMSGIENVGEI